MKQFYSRKLEQPQTRRDGLANFVQIIINQIEADENRNALLSAVDLLEDIRCGIYDDAMVDAKAVNVARAEAEAEHQSDIIKATQRGYEKGVADEKSRMAKALALIET